MLTEGVELDTVSDNIRHAACGEIVIHEGEVAKRYHQDLFSLSDTCYLPAGENIIGSILAASREDVGKLHISACWETILKVALWSQGPPGMHDVLALLRKSGLAEAELEPFRRAEVSDIFPWLYYGKRFDILRKVCNAAKTKAEAKCGVKTLRVHCHIVSEETGKIASSSL